MANQMDLGFGELDNYQERLVKALEGVPTSERFRIARSIAGSEWRDHPMALRERRDPTAGTLKTTWTGPGQPQIQQFDAETAITMSYMLNSIVYACVNVIAGAFTQAVFKAGIDPTKKRSISIDSQLHRLLGPPPGTPAPRWTARKLFHWSVRSKVVTGKVGWEIECVQPRGKGMIVHLWPLVSTLLSPVPADGGLDYFTEFKYGRRGRTQKTLNNDQVFYVWQAGLGDPREPESALSPSRLDVSAANQFDRYTVALLKNNNIPANIISYLPFEDEDEELAWQRQFSSKYKGVDNAGATLFHKVTDVGGDMADVQGAIHVEQLGAIQRDTQALETYRVKVTNICIALGVPMSMLDASNRTFSNGGLEAQNFYQQRMMPEWQEWSEEVNSQIAPRVGNEVGWFDYDHIQALKPPTKFQQVNPVDLRDAEIVLRDEVREELGLQDWESANANQPKDTAQGIADKIDPESWRQLANAASVFIQNGFDREAVLAALGLPAIKVAEAMPPADDPTGDAPMMDEEPPVPPPAAVPVRERNAEARTDYVAAQAAVVDGLEQTWERAWVRFFHRQEAATLSRLKGSRGSRMLAELRTDPPADPVPNYTPIDNVFDTVFWFAATEEFAASLLEGVFAAGATRVAAQAGISFNFHDPAIDLLIANRANFIAGQINDTTLKALRDTLIEGVNKGEDVNELGKRVQAVFEGRSTSGARTIARTEVVSAYQQSSHAFATSLPSSVIAGHSWSAHLDGRTRDSHRDPELAKPRGIHEPFRVGGAHMLHPGDPMGPPEEVINCRCTELYYSQEEMDAFSQGALAPDRSGMVGRRATLRVLRVVAAGKMDEFAAIAALGGKA